MHPLWGLLCNVLIRVIWGGAPPPLFGLDKNLTSFLRTSNPLNVRSRMLSEAYWCQLDERTAHKPEADLRRTQKQWSPSLGVWYIAFLFCWWISVNPMTLTIQPTFWPKVMHKEEIMRFHTGHWAQQVGFWT